MAISGSGDITFKIIMIFNNNIINSSALSTEDWNKFTP